MGLQLVIIDFEIFSWMDEGRQQVDDLRGLNGQMGGLVLLRIGEANSSFCTI